MNRVRILALFALSSLAQSARAEDPCSYTCAVPASSMLVADKWHPFRRVFDVAEQPDRPAWLDLGVFSNHVQPAMTAWRQNTGLDIKAGAEAEVEVQYVTNPADWHGESDDRGWVDRIPGEDSYVAKAIIQIDCFSALDSDWNDESGSCPLIHPTNPHLSEIDLTGVFVHEFGHVLCLTHVVGSPTCTVMDDRIGRGDCTRRSIFDLDRNAILCRYPFLASDARVAGFGIVGKQVAWVVSSESGTTGYEIEMAGAPFERGVTVHREPKGIGLHSVMVDVDTTKWYRLIESDRSGRRTHAASARPKPKTSTHGQAVTTRERSPVQAVPGRVTYGDQPTCVILASYSNQLQAQTIALHWELLFGQNVRVEYVAGTSNPPASAQEARSNVHSIAKAYYEANGTRLFHILGDHATIAGHFEAGQFPGGIYLDSSDQELGDFDYDGVPDAVVTRWPSGNPYDALGRMVDYRYVASGRGDRLSMFLVGDLDQVPIGDVPPGAGALTLLMADDVRSALAAIQPWETIQTHKWSQYPDLGDRNVAIANRLNTYKPELLVMLAPSSMYSMPADWFSRWGTISPSWSMNLINPSTPPPVVIAQSCETAKFSLQDAICNDFMGVPFHIGSGAIAWMGSYRAVAYQTVSHVVARNVVEELFRNPYRSMAESWLLAIQRGYEELGGQADYRAALNNCIFLGDPISTFRPAPTIKSFRKPKNGGALTAMPPAIVTGCPAGDEDWIIIEVSIDARDYPVPLAAEDITISQPDNPEIVYYPEVPLINSDAAPTLVNDNPDYPNGCYETTFTLKSIGGCGEGKAEVRIQGSHAGFAYVAAKSVDHIIVDASNQTRGAVDLADFSWLVSHYESSRCNCVWQKQYSACADFAAADTSVSLGDVSFFVSHYNHEDAGSGGSPLLANAGIPSEISLSFQEEYRASSDRVLRVEIALENVVPFSVMLLALKNDLPNLEFSEWIGHYTGEIVCGEATRGGDGHVFVGLAGTKQAQPARVDLGEIVFTVQGTEPLNLNHINLVVADLLETAGAEVSMTSSVSRTIEPPKYRSWLSQNYPNPFNPQTTITFSLAQRGALRLEVFDVRGARVKTLADTFFEKGIHQARWDGTDSAGEQVASGIYFYRLRMGAFVETKRMVLLK